MNCDRKKSAKGNCNMDLSQRECKQCARPLKWEPNIETNCNCMDSIYHISCIFGSKECIYCNYRYPTWLIKLITLIKRKRIDAEYKRQKKREGKTQSNRKQIKETIEALLIIRKIKIENSELDFE